MRHFSFVRHGHSFHNELFLTLGEKAYTHPSVIGSSLTSKGLEQTVKLKNEIQSLEKFNLILVSPLDRCLQTVQQIIDGMEDIPEIVSLDEMIEYEISDIANYRKDKKDLVNLYPFVNFEYTTDVFKNPNFDNLISLRKRIDSFKNFVSMLSPKYKRILVIGHTSWLNMLIFNNPDLSDLDHCKVYNYSIPK